MLGMAFLLGGLRHHVQEFNRATARLQAGMLFLAAFALMVPAAISASDRPDARRPDPATERRVVVCCCSSPMSSACSFRCARTASCSPARPTRPGRTKSTWPVGVAVALLVIVTVVVALVSEVFVGSVQHAALTFGMSPAFVGFVVVAIVGAAAEMTTAFAAARKNRLDLSVGIALGSSSQIALFVAPVLVLLSLFIAPVPLDLSFWPGAIVAVLFSTLAVAFVTNSGRSAWYIGVLLLVLYATFAMTLYVLPPALG